MHIVDIDRDYDFVYAEDIHLSCPPPDYVVRVDPVFCQPGVEVRVGKPASWVAGLSRRSARRACSNLFAPPLQPEHNHLTVEPHTGLQTLDLVDRDVQPVLISHQVVSGGVLYK